LTLVKLSDSGSGGTKGDHGPINWMELEIRKCVYKRRSGPLLKQRVIKEFGKAQIGRTATGGLSI